MIKYDQIISRLEENHQEYTVEPMENGYRMVISAYGGRIFGPFDAEGNSMAWISPVFETKESYSAFLESGNWDLGGDRLWLAPENPFNVPDDSDFLGSYTVPTHLDPGRYSLSRNYGAATLSMYAKLKLHNTVVDEKEYRIERSVQSIKDPLAGLLDHDAVYCGYEHEIYFEETVHDAMEAEAWNLLQMRAGGYYYIPTTVKLPFYARYYDEFEPGYHEVLDDYVKLKADGKSRYKVGYRSVFTTGRTGYVNKINGKLYLCVRCFHSDVNGRYKKKSDFAEPGNAFHIYNDDGNKGAFTEHECSGQPIGGKTGRKRSIDKVTTLYYVGSEPTLRKIMNELVGIDVVHMDVNP